MAEIEHMPPVSNATVRRLSHATGYIGLGMLNEATEELSAIPREEWALPEVLSTRINLHTAKKEWSMVTGFGQQLAMRCPENEDGCCHK